MTQEFSQNQRMRQLIALEGRACRATSAQVTQRARLRSGAPRAASFNALKAFLASSASL